MLRKFILYFVFSAVVVTALFFTIAYYATYSKGDWTGELIKFSNKGYVFKTWEGEISKGTLVATQTFKFSVLDSDKEVIEDLKKNQGQYVRVTYIERYATFPWWGDSHHYVTKVQKEKSPLR